MPELGSPVQVYHTSSGEVRIRSNGWLESRSGCGELVWYWNEISSIQPGANSNDAEFMQKRVCVGGGPSSKTWPR